MGFFKILIHLSIEAWKNYQLPLPKKKSWRRSLSELIGHLAHESMYKVITLSWAMGQKQALWKISQFLIILSGPHLRKTKEGNRKNVGTEHHTSFVVTAKRLTSDFLESDC